MTTQTGPARLSNETRAPGTVRANRLLIALVGLVLALLGLATLAAGLGVLGSAAEKKPVLDGTAQDWLTGHSWIWWAVAGAGLLIALISLRWLLGQASSNRVSTLRVGEDTDGGRTRLYAAALTDAVENEIESYRGVTRARAHLSGSPSAPRLSLTVALDGRVDVAEVQQRISSQAVDHARQALSAESLPTRLEFGVPKVAGRDVR
jgi:hypothetical protein